jgi:hypothetical protein
MALTMLDKHPETSDRSAWPPEIAAEFEQEKKNPNPCVGNGRSASSPASVSASTATCSTISGPR